MGKKTPYRTLRYFIVSIIVLVILACLLPFFLKGPDNRALITPDQIKLPELKIPKKISQGNQPEAASSKASPPARQRKVYKWKDKNDVWHFTDYPNPDGPSQIIYVSTNKPETQSSVKTNAPQTEALKEKDGNLNSGFSFPKNLSPSKVKQLKEEAEALKKELEKRYQELDQKID